LKKQILDATYVAAIELTIVAALLTLL